MCPRQGVRSNHVAGGGTEMWLGEGIPKSARMCEGQLQKQQALEVASA
jgi:hypothetical protein